MLTVSVIIFSFRQVLSSWNEFFVIGEKIKPRCSEDKFDSLWKISRCLQWKLEEESDCITAKAYSILPRYACESLCEKTVDKFEKADRIQQDIGDNSSIVRALCLGKLGRCYGQRKQLNRAAPFIRKSVEISEMKPHNKMQMWNVGMILGHLQWLVTLSFLWVTKTEFHLTISSKQVMGIKKTIYKEIFSGSNTKFSILILQNLDKKDCNFLAW